MAKPPNEDLEAFLRRQDAEELVAVLLELAQDHEPVWARLARMQVTDRPDKLAAAFRKTLSDWHRSPTYHDYRTAGEFGRLLAVWLDQVARELLPRDPAAALRLFEAFIKADAAWFDRADDSGGDIGDAVRAACHHWLLAAARCPTPPDGWPKRLLKLYDADRYGACDELLRHAHLLLDEAAQRALVTRLEAQLAQALAAAAHAQAPSIDVFRLAASLSLLAESLRDPDVLVRATLGHSPKPNPLQRETFVRAYLDAERPADALIWLEDGWSQFEDRRQDLLAETLERLGRHDDGNDLKP